MPSPLPSEVGDLDSLESLDRDLLTLFVCGPGQGEAVLVALPETGWLVLDGAGIAGVFPQQRVLDRFRGEEEPVDAVLLTHPHRDHYRGFVELLDELGKHVLHVGCLSLYFADIEKSSAELELHALEGGVDPNSPIDHLRGGVRTVLERVRDEWELDPARVLSLVSGSGIPLSTGAASARVLAPDKDGAIEFFTSDGLSRRIRKSANDVSAVVEINFGGTRLVLGGDLPEVVLRSGKLRPVATGWRTVCTTHGSQCEHTALKIPHHGSKEALAMCLVGQRAESPPRHWAVTPFNVHPRLPSFDPGDGVDVLLAQEREIHLSAMPRAWRAQSPLSPRTPRSAVTSAGVAIAGLPATFSPPVWEILGLDPVDCIWALVFDDAGRLVARYRARASTLIHR